MAEVEVEEAGGIEHGFIEDLSDLGGDVVVNCVGLGAKRAMR